jgi:hypothetical protein
MGTRSAPIRTTIIQKNLSDFAYVCFTEKTLKSLHHSAKSAIGILGRKVIMEVPDETVKPLHTSDLGDARSTSADELVRSESFFTW